MDPRDQKVQLLLEQRYSEDAAYLAAWGMPRTTVDSLRLSGVLPPVQTVDPATLDVGKFRAANAASAEGEVTTEGASQDIPKRRGEDRQGVAGFYHDYGNLAKIRGEVRDGAALLPVYSADEARQRRMEAKGIDGFLATYGGRATGLLWPLIAGQQVVFGKMRGESWRSALARFNPTWIDPDTEEETSGWGEWWESVSNSLRDVARNVRDPKVQLQAATGVGVGVPAPNLLAYLQARPESVDEARKRAEMFAENGLTGIDLVKAWRAGYGVAGGLAFGQEEADNGFDVLDLVFPGVSPQGKFISDDPTERAQQIAQIEKFTQDYYTNIFDDLGPVSAATVKTLDDWVGLGLDVFLDPLIGLADAPVEAVNVARAIAPASSSSRLLGAIARRTGRADAVIEYLKSADQAYQDAAKQVARADTPTNRRRLLQMKSQKQQAEAMASQALKDHPIESLVVQAADEMGVASANVDPTKMEVVPRPDETYADFIDASTFDQLGKNAPTADKRKLAILSAMRRNINIGARKNMPEDILRQWERTYEFVKNADPENVPSIVSRFTGKRLATEGPELLTDTPIDFDHATRSMLIDEEGQSILHIGHWDESMEAERIAYGPEDAEWWSATIQDVVNGRPVDNLMAPADMSVAKFQTAWAMRPKGVTMEGTINLDELNRGARIAAKKANKARRGRIAELERKTTGYAIDAHGQVVGTGRKGKGKFQPGPYERRGVDPDKIKEVAFERRSGQFLAAKYRKSIEADIRRDLQELADLRMMDDVEAARYDWTAAGGNPLKTNVEAAQWNRTLRELVGDGLMRGLYPESWSALSTKGVFASILFPLREPARALQSTYPKLWERVRSGMRSKDIEFKRAVSSFRQALEESGAYRMKSDGALEMVDLNLNDAMYRVLNTAEDAPEYVGLVDALPEKARVAVRRFRQTLDYYAKKQGIYDSDKYIEGYIHWMMDPHNNAGFLQEVRANPSLRTFARHLMERDGAGNPAYTQNLGSIAEMYSAAMSRKMHLEPLLMDMDSMAREFGALNPNHKNWILGEVKRINSLVSGAPSRWGNKLDSMIMNITDTLRRSGIPGADRLTYNPGSPGRALMGVTSSAYAAQLTLTPHYFPMALSTSIATTAGESGLLSTLHYASVMSSADGQALARAAGISEQYKKIMENTNMRKITDALSDLEFLTPSINRTEAYIRGVGFHAAAHRLAREQGFRNIGDAILNGQGNAIIAEAARYTEETNHMFGVLGKPTIFSTASRSVGVGATQFLSFIPKQTEALLSMSLKNPGYFHRYMMVSGWLQRVAATELGIDMGSYVGLGYLPGRVSDARSMATELALSGFAWLSEYGSALTGHGDVQRLHQTGVKFEESLEQFVPFVRMAGQRITAVKAALMTMFEGTMEEYGLASQLVKKYDRDGALQRQYNFTLPDPNDLESSMGTDLFAAVTGLRSMNDSIANEKRQYKRDLEQRQASAVLRSTIELRKAIRTGDVDGYVRAAGILSEHGLSIDVGNVARAEIQSQLIEEELRTLMALPINLRAEYIEKSGLGDDEAP